MSDRSFWDVMLEILAWVVVVLPIALLWLLCLLGRPRAEPSVENSFAVVPWIPEE